MRVDAALPRATLAFLNERLSRLEAVCRDRGVPFHDDAGVDDHLQRVLLASDFAYESFLADALLLGPEFLQLMSDPRHADARAGALSAVREDAAVATLLRQFRRREALRLIWRDVNGADSIETTLAGASVLAETCIEMALRAAERWIGERHGQICDAHGRVQRLVVLALGKLGGGELNFSSDVDLVFAYAEGGESNGRRPLEASDYYARIAQALVALLAERNVDGYVYRVDLRLRPFGGAGRVAISFAAMEQYFQREGRDWERYAWIKARPVAGDRNAGNRLLEILRPFVFRRYLDYGAFAGLREMKALIDAEVARKDLADDLKLGPGGIREIEFIVQLAQLIRGGREPALRTRGLLAALAACEQLGFMPAARARTLRDAYRFLRRLENRVQMLADQQTHEIPSDPALRERVALALGYADWAALGGELDRQRGAVADEFVALMAVDARGDARQAQAEWPAFWRGAARGEDIDRTPLRAAGFDRADEIVAALATFFASAGFRNMSARARGRLDRLMPAVFAAAAGSSQATACLLRLLRLIAAVARRSVYLALLDEQPVALRRLCEVFSASAFLAERVIAHPLLLDDLFDDHGNELPLSHRRMRDEFAAELARRLANLEGTDAEAEIELIQELRQSALFRIGLAFIGRRIDGVEVARALAVVADVVIAAVVRIAERDFIASYGGFAEHAAPLLLVIAYGSLGGAELGFSSDLDLVFVYDAERIDGSSDGARPLDAARYISRLAQRVVHLLGVLTRAGRLYEVDVRLRPDGTKGMLVQSFSAFAAYQRERARVWELQALARARALGGDPALARRFAQLRASLLGVPRAAAVREEIVSMRARWRAERDRSDRDVFDLKQGLGGLVDVEFLLQGLVMLHAGATSDLLASGNSADLIAAVANAGLIAAADADALARAHADLVTRSIACTLDGRSRVTPRGAALDQTIDTVVRVARGCGFAFDRVSPTTLERIDAGFSDADP